MNPEELVKKKEQNEHVRRKIHMVEGYYPEAELITYEVVDEKGTIVGIKKQLPLPIKEEWFYLCYPNGVIRTRIETANKNFVEASCALYASYDLPEEQYLRKESAVIGVRFDNPYCQNKTQEEIIGITANIAKAKAESNTLYKAGFGLQYESKDTFSTAMDEAEKEEFDKIALPNPVKPAVVPRRGKKDAETATNPPYNNKVEEKKEAEKKVIAASGNQEFEPSESAPEKAVPSGSILEMQEGMEKQKDAVSSDSTMETKVVAEKKEESTMSYEEALSYRCSVPQYETLRDMVKGNIQQVVYLIQKSPHEEERKACLVIAENNDVVKSILLRKGMANEA